MIQIEALPLCAKDSQSLNRLQAAIDNESTYRKKVDKAKAIWKSKPRKPFERIRSILSEMCSGSRRCMYCEDSCADEIEHFRPKTIYPESTFFWSNMLYACGPCNGPKNDAFAVFRWSDGAQVEVSRPPGAPVSPPPVGDPLLIDPRSEDPLVFMELDLLDTFMFVETAEEGTPDFLRARYTIDVLRLNTRDYLLAARKEAFHNYRARLLEYTQAKRLGASDAELDQLKLALLHMSHPTVWKEIKRQWQFMDGLRDLFTAAPEALNW